MGKILPFARACLNESEEQLRSIPHYGAQVDVLESKYFTSRYEYVLQLCKDFYRLKQTICGKGYGSRKRFNSSNEEASSILQDFSGLEILQSWAVLLNSGHLFYTFDTERCLLFILDKELDSRTNFIKLSTDFETPLKDIKYSIRHEFEDQLDKVRLYSFHYLLALWRLRDNGISKLDNKDRQKAQQLIKAFLLPQNQNIKILKATYRRVRMLSYLKIHSRLPDSCHVISEINGPDLQELFPVDAHLEADWLSSSRWKALEAIDRYDAETLFRSKDATRQSLRHTKEFKAWWEGNKKSFIEKLDSLFIRPENWPYTMQKDLKHFARLQVPSSVSWLNEVRLFLNNDEKKSPWGSSDFFISPSPGKDILQLDLFSGKDGLSIEALEHTTRQLTRAYCERLHDQGQEALWMTTARLIAQTFQSILSPEFGLRIHPVDAPPTHRGYACVGSTYEFVRGHAKAFLPYALDAQRKSEVRQLIYLADQVVGWRDPSMLMLAKTFIFHRNTSSKDEKTEIDGIIGFFQEKKLKWLIMETKKTPKGNGERQLRKNFLTSINKSIDQTGWEIQKKKYGQHTNWYLIIESPEYLIPSPD